ncbi:tRNA dihydrouridine synthase DusB [Rhizobium sp. L1K21]|uniref:tRNA dihydrouridine synthase DusB n=1 Tax=Rhizobium sp. L1K21 TaxID=2954933 RepID=UPI002091EDD9|nr:tRNA dihydrouridine synthase DusB [Rhizobium sp. L1K21]MCO6185937.1 tRNA dihydrouridine synthase DusB [Rhizobium sp. L1K21]
MVGNVRIRNRVLLAPLSGVSDLPFREIAWQYGAGVTVTEMIASRELVNDMRESRIRMRRSSTSPHVVQLAGRDAHWLAEAARVAEGEGADIIDINMGCPAKKVTGGYCGSALMRDSALALSLVEAVVAAVKVPVTVKMRLGWDEYSLNAPEIAHGAELAGAQMITVHGRTRMQFYEGQADWDAIAAVRDVIKVPLVANGDVASTGDAHEIMRRSGADAVMIGRAAQGQPWLPGLVAGMCKRPKHSEIADIFEHQYRGMLTLYGAEMAVRHARKHVGWYLDRHAVALPKEDRQAIMTSRDAETVIRLVRAAILSSGPADDLAGIREYEAA